MGIVRMGPPTELLATLAKVHKVQNFVETGTFFGYTAAWASEIFERVYTIEYSPHSYEQVKKQFRGKINIEFIFGDSREKLQELMCFLKNPAVFWLDAHWSGGLTYGESDQCPLLEEIETINSSALDHFIFIDDARLFMSPPQSPHNVEQWPNLVEVLNALKSKDQSRYIVIIEDVIIAVPDFAKSTTISYCRKVNARIWEEYGQSQKTSDLQKGITLITKGLRSKIKSLTIKSANKKNLLKKANKYD